jgi:hypothetical protein
MHCLQYAICRDRSVYNTKNLSDDDIRKLAWALNSDRVERFNRCPKCQQWSDVLSNECPAKKAT